MTTSRRRSGTASLGPLHPDAGPERRELALALRELFQRLEMPLRAYASKEARAASSVSRTLSGERAAQEDFVKNLLHDAGEPPRPPLPDEETARVWALFRKDEESRMDPAGRIRLLERSRRELEERLREVENSRAAADTNGTAAEMDSLRHRLHQREQELARVEQERDQLARRIGKLLAEAGPRDGGGPVVIRSAFAPWYRPEPRPDRGQYWPAYADLLARRGWQASRVAGLDEATNQVVEKLADPSAAEAYQSKGLVIAPVQSGASAHITGTVAKAVDAGYRLVIVLTGPTNALRYQLQRTLDRDLVGRENILRGAGQSEDSEYVDDPDWFKADGFLRHGRRPASDGGFDIVRLTTRDNDYTGLRQELAAVEFEKRMPGLPLHDPENLHAASARLMVVKKNKTILSKLVKDLKSIHLPLAEIPTLIIDDSTEWDPGAVNTHRKATGTGKAGLTSVQATMAELLGLMPRAQYVAYATSPFVGTLMDSAASEDLFPRDFIVSLPRPAGYVGVGDFHDIDSDVPAEQRTFANSQEKAHVRNLVLRDKDDDQGERQAMDMFVLTGAVKLYRAARGEIEARTGYRHHTMIVHSSDLIGRKREHAARLRRLWYEGSYDRAEGLGRLRELYERDVEPVSCERADGFPVPESFDELAPYVSAAWSRIDSDGNAVVIESRYTDGEHDRYELDFTRRHIWKILVCGSRLSHGGTVEGLTVIYQGPRTDSAVALSGIGRWAGFRVGYRDLMRLYFAQVPGDTGGGVFDAFAAIFRDQRSFEEDMARYAVEVDGRPQLTPDQVPPLLAQHLGALDAEQRRSALFNAELVEIRSPGRWIEPLAYPVDAVAKARNIQQWRPLLDVLAEPRVLSGRSASLRARTGLVPHARLMDALSALEGAGPKLRPHLSYLEQLGREPGSQWLLVVPHPAGDGPTASVLGFESLPLFSRARRGDGFGRFTNPSHESAVEAAMGRGDGAPSPLGAVLLYPIHEGEDGSAKEGEADPSQIVMGVGIYTPEKGKESPLLRFRSLRRP
ncbi:Z1 domain-containing protein [Streptomyces erythrochromogenes]|uniref:Z1 domain-containing protein n=1 Tax=Streptomyces erythrochromogenes TaxID=285574 RepID=UPI0022527F61|nr:Z1 domain-containing protein [Streptomyces erythrochromogenes]MCX5589634.1 Z1 domain-containing protein [Streptomyces erythrochromogenes]